MHFDTKSLYLFPRSLLYLAQKAVCDQDLASSYNFVSDMSIIGFLKAKYIIRKFHYLAPYPNPLKAITMTY